MRLIDRSGGSAWLNRRGGVFLLNAGQIAHADLPLLESAARSMEAVVDRLVRADDQLLLLFAPPFDQTAHDPGYIKGYPPGIRENSGQYTHAAVWVVWAFAELGWGDRATALFQLLNPPYPSARRFGTIRVGTLVPCSTLSVTLPDANPRGPV
jgi:hypothetical protein